MLKVLTKRRRLARARGLGVALLLGMTHVSAAVELSGAVEPPLPDPMRPASVTRAAPPAPRVDADVAPIYTLQAIKIEPHHRAALINDQLVTEGRSIDLAKVLKISADEVVISTNGKPTRLRLNAHDIKHPAAQRLH